MQDLPEYLLKAEATVIVDAHSADNDGDKFWTSSGGAILARDIARPKRAVAILNQLPRDPALRAFNKSPTPKPPAPPQDGGSCGSIEARWDSRKR